MNPWPLPPALAGILLLAACQTMEPPVDIDWEPDDGSSVAKADWAVSSFLDFSVTNNVWGKGAVQDYRQWLFHRTGTDPFPLGWKWDWPPVRTEDVKGYPSLTYGQTPWAARSTNGVLPRKIADIRELTVTWDLDLRVQGKYNLAFDLWITRQPGSDLPARRNIAREIMVWVDAKGFTFPREWSRRKVTVDGESFDFYRAENLATTDYQRDFLVFVSRVPRQGGTLKIRAFLDFLLSQGFVDEGEFLGNVDLGTEVWYGTGEVNLQTFQVEARFAD